MSTPVNCVRFNDASLYLDSFEVAIPSSYRYSLGLLLLSDIFFNPLFTIGLEHRFNDVHLHAGTNQLPMVRGMYLVKKWTNPISKTAEQQRLKDPEKDINPMLNLRN